MALRWCYLMGVMASIQFEPMMPPRRVYFKQTSSMNQ
jgi:hypothetical protein